MTLLRFGSCLKRRGFIKYVAVSIPLLLLLLACPQLTTGNLIFTAALPTKWVPIQVRIDFGPAGKPLLEREVQILEGATPKEALKQIVPIVEGSACCDPAEVKGIDGVTIDPMENRWWRLKINGTSKKASPHKSHLKAGDVMEWVYFQDAQ